MEYHPSLIRFLGARPTKEDFDELVDSFQLVLPKGIPRAVLKGSLLHLLDEEVTEERLQTTSWRLAANLERLREGKPVLPWRMQIEDEWVPVQITSVDPVRSRRGDIRTRITVKILAGSAASLETTAEWSKPFCSLRASRLGFSPSWGQYPYRHQNQLVGLRMHVLLSAEKSGKYPCFEQGLEKETSSTLKYNRQLIRMRARLPESGFECPEGYRHACHLCPVGYDECPVGTHPVTFVPGKCNRCNERAWFDPSKPKQVTCVTCSEEELLRGE